MVPAQKFELMQQKSITTQRTIALIIHKQYVVIFN